MIEHFQCISDLLLRYKNHYIFKAIAAKPSCNFQNSPRNIIGVPSHVARGQQLSHRIFWKEFIKESNTTIMKKALSANFLHNLTKILEHLD